MFEKEYEEVVTAIENKRRFGNLKGVEITAKVLELLGHPEQNFPVIHIAGTNGKGSVSAFCVLFYRKAVIKQGCSPPRIWWILESGFRWTEK